MDNLLSVFSGRRLRPSKEFSFTSALPSGFAYTRSDSVATYVDASGVMQLSSSNAPRFNHDASGAPLGMMFEETRQNKCTNTNANMGATTGLTKGGDAASVLQLASDASALTAAGLSSVCSNGNVFELDNSAGGTTAHVTFSGTTGNTNAHSISIYARMVSGTFGTIQFTGATPGVVSFNATSYTRVRSENITPSGTTVQMRINAAAGARIRFVLNQMEEGAFATSAIKIAGSAATRAADFLQYAGLNNAAWWNAAQGSVIVECNPYQANNQVNAAGLFVAGSSGGFPTDAIYLQTNNGSNKASAWIKDTGGSTNVATLTGVIPGRKNSVAHIYRNNVNIQPVAGPGVYGVQTAASRNASNIVTLTVGSFASGTLNFNGHISRLTFFKKAITPHQTTRYMTGTKTGHTERAIIATGQSNMSGYFAATTGLTNGGELAFLQTLNTVWGASTRNHVINAATSATAIADWQEGGAALAKWRAIAAAYIAAGGRIEGILWDQGESDMGKTVSQFKTAYLGIFQSMRSFLAARGQGSVLICIIPLGRYLLADTSTHNTHCSHLRQAQQELAADYSSWLCIAPEKFTQPMTDTTHLTDAGYTANAPLVLRKLLKFKGESISGGVDGPIITNVLLSGSTVTVTIAHDSGGTDFTPTSSIGGFQFFDGGTEIAITAAVRTNATTITLTLASTPAGFTLELWYAWGSIYDDAGSTLVRDNSVNALPLRSGKWGGL